MRTICLSLTVFSLSMLLTLQPLLADQHLKPAVKKPYAVEKVLDGLTNPSSVAFGPKGELTVCDSGNGRVVLVKDGKAHDYITGFPTEYWKVDKEAGTKRFKLGPLSALWVGDTLAVTNSGLGDGEDHILFFTGPGKASDGKATNAVSPTSDDPADKGEGNFIGLSANKAGTQLFVCGQGSDAKTWLLTCNVKNKKLKPLLSADEHDIATNSPMESLVMGRFVYVLYSGAGGKVDGRIVKWDLKEKKPAAQWAVPELVNPMGMAFIPGTRQLVVVENNWALTKVNPGRLARVTLPKEGGEAKVRIIGENFHGPVSCAFGPDGKLYIAQLGQAFDKNHGAVYAVTGIKKPEKKEAKKEK